MDIAYFKKLSAVLSTPFFNKVQVLALHDGHPLSGQPMGGLLVRYG